MIIERLSGIATELGEGPLWDVARQCLWCVDIMRGHVHRVEAATGADRVYDIGQPVGAVALRERGDLLCAVRDGFACLDVDTGAVAMIAAVEADNPRTRMNDGAVDAMGRFWAGTMSMHREREQGALYRLDPDGTVTRHLTGVTTSNGIDWSGDNTRMFYIDTGRPQIDVFDFDLVRGELANRRVFVTIDPAEGKPDGLVLDAEDHVWVALWGGAKVIQFAPDGTRVREIALSAPRTTKPAFGGPDLTDLFVTSAWINMTPEERREAPDSGGLFRCRPVSPGRAPHRAR